MLKVMLRKNTTVVRNLTFFDPKQKTPNDTVPWILKAEPWTLNAEEWRAEHEG